MFQHNPNVSFINVHRFYSTRLAFMEYLREKRTDFSSALSLSLKISGILRNTSGLYSVSPVQKHTLAIR